MASNINGKRKFRPEQLLYHFPLVMALILWCVLVLKEQFFLKKVEDLSLFLFDRMFIMESLSIPGGFLGLAGSFLTQFLYFPWIGALLWTSLLLLVFHLTVRVFRIPDNLRFLALIPVALLIISNMSLGYKVFLMREQDHFFAPLTGYLISLVPLAVIRKIKASGNRILFSALWTVFGFALFGTFAFTGILTAVCWELTNQELPRRERFVLCMSSIAFIAIFPLIIYSLYTSYRLADSWSLGLPSISEDELTHSIRTPIWIALACQLLLSLAHSKLSSISITGKNNIIIGFSAYFVIIATVGVLWFKDDNFHTELAMSDAIDHFDWKGTVEIYIDASNSHNRSDAKAYAARSEKLASVKDADMITDIVEKYSSRFFEPTRLMVLYRDLALLKTNRALDEAFTMNDGGKPQKSTKTLPMAWQSGKQFYLQYGLVNMCYRWCLEDVIEHNWSYSTLKYMTMHCVIMQESEFAEKYINKLGKTLFYRNWARQQRKLSRDSLAMAAAEPYKNILPYMCFEDRMSNDMVKTEVFLINHFLNDEPLNATPEYDRAALLFAMRIQDIPRFRERLYYYAHSNRVNVLPRAVQEASLLYDRLEKKDSGLPYDNKVIQSYDSFNKYVQSHAIRNMKEAEYPFGQKFGNTFYYYYYFVRNLQTY